MFVGRGVDVPVGVQVTVAVLVIVGVLVMLGVRVGVLVTVFVGVMDGVGVKVLVGACVAVGIGVIGPLSYSSTLLRDPVSLLKPPVARTLPLSSTALACWRRAVLRLPVPLHVPPAGS